MAEKGDGDRVRRDVNGDKSDHLQNHIHLTNCIHLKNHLHKQSPFAGDRSLLRDLVTLQKSRRLRDPSESTRSLRSPSMIDDVILQRRGRDAFASRRFENGGECTRRMPGSSPPAADPPISRATSGLDDRRRMRREESSRKILENGVSNRSNGKSVNKKDMPLEAEEMGEEAARNTNSHGKVTKKEKRRRFRSARRNRPSIPTRDAKTQPETSNSFLQGNDDHNGSTIQGNKCGIPWNWSRIHHSGKSFLDMAGRSLSRGLSESRSKKEGAISDKPITSGNSSPSNMFGREALPLLLDASESQKSIDCFPWIHDYSGELSIFADKQETESDLASQGHMVLKQHQNLTQKYMPRTFNDLVGQNLVVQALSNAVMKRKIGLLYVFYGPHGTGKTACARIFARALNCQSVESPKPCGFCDSCIADEKGKSRNVREIVPVNNIDYEGVLELFENHIASQHRSEYGVFIFDECDAMSSDCWNAMLKVICGAPRRVVIILVCSSLDALPHVIVSRCQKFSFTKLRDAEMVRALQLIASKEDLDIDRDALKLIASRSDGSLRDAEMTLEQLSLLGGKISLCLVQELIGLISDEKLVDLLDFALSADTINTVKKLRDIMASGVEPLALMSQLATVITDILAGSYDSAKQRPKRKFFHQHALSNEDMEKLRQALKTLSEAEKQLRVSSERITWLTAALLQLAPDQRYTAPISSAGTSSDHSPVVVDPRVRSTKGNALAAADKFNRGTEEIWLEVLENIKIKSLKEFMHKEGKMASVSYGAAPTVHLLFNSQLTKSVVEKFRSRILQAFEAVVGSPVTIEIRQGSREDTGEGQILLRGLELSASDEIVQVEDDSQSESERHKNQIVFAGKAFDEAELSERNQSLSIVRRKVSLGDVIQQHADGLSKPQAASVADKLEQQNLRLEARSRRMLCWNPPKITHPKLSCLKIRRKKLRKFVSCGRCLSARSQ
ncbi:LOW QUALITY PROTEIN: protein STICHEL-like 3 [Salvia miltiorrhiza]|uniref:LOW QUALITY PROTEIN: protein STICHEL-like 3 n=1 Tax=Salvia miltiorrhiza TaxID=226208 RepID=UPI0025AD9416|nr:LOW QUALITY PROTEIN: protein STICHEL-like 3 [Salvia miltiorrhiza]